MLAKATTAPRSDSSKDCELALQHATWAENTRRGIPADFPAPHCCF